MTIEEFQANPELMTEYSRWINQDIAHIVFGVVQETFCRPILPNQLRELINKNTSEFCLGENSGSWKMLDAVRSLHALESKSELPSETYEPIPDEDNKGDV